MSGTVTLSEPGVFSARGKVHVSRDGIPFYVFERRGEFKFTLPPGTYKLSGGRFVSTMPERPVAALPPPIHPLPDRVTLKFKPNPNKCSVDLKRGVITCDPSFRDLPPFVLVFVLLHEVGHYFYDTEADCDAYAAREMYARGYNPSQINIATNLSLGDAYRRRCNDRLTRNLR